MSRVAVFVPELYQGGTLRAAKDVAKMISLGASRIGADTDVVFGYRPGVITPAIDLKDLWEAGIATREIGFRLVKAEHARVMTRLEGVDRPLTNDTYCLISDGANDFLDCDLWLLISDRLQVPLLPLRPFGIFVFDCIQRYVPEIWGDEGWVLQSTAFIPLLRNADFILATTPSTLNDLNSFVGVPRARLRRIPMFFEKLALHPDDVPSPSPRDYFVWTSNSTPHKNHERVLEALARYYDHLGGRLKAVMVGQCTEDFDPRRKYPFQRSDPVYAEKIRRLIAQRPSLKENLDIRGYPPDEAYLSIIRNARFLLHANLYDNGSFSVIDAAYLGAPSLSSRYPAMEFMNESFDLNLTFFDPFDVVDIAAKLKEMEARGDKVRLPDPARLDEASWRNVAPDFYQAIQPYLRRRPSGVRG
ncbi:MAG: glycosyltransferase [Planctomycetota bacterium]